MNNLILYYKLIAKEDTMMKKILILFTIITLILAASGCNLTEDGPLQTMEKLEEESLSYKIEKIVLSKGFQSIEPSVEVLNKNSNLKLLISTGLIESSGVTINRITKSGKEINIYIDRLLEKGKVQLAVPQIMIEVEEPVVEKLEELNYNIISQNYEPIALKFNKSQILNKIYSQYKISPNTVPTVDLTKRKDQLFWDISFNSIFDKENHESPLVNFNVKVDAYTGDVLDLEKDDISTYVDDGSLLDYIPHSCLLYKRQHENKDNKTYESLWSYNIETGEKKKLYTSKDKIQSALFSPNNKYVSLIEMDDNKTDLYIIMVSNNATYKVTSVNYLHPKLMKWKDENSLYFVDINGHRSTLLTYDVEENSSKVQFDLGISVDDFDVFNGNFLFVESQDDSLNKTIYLKEKDMELEEIDKGFKATFINENNIAYLKNLEKEDKNTFHIYDIKKQEEINDLDYDISNYFKLDEGNMILIEKNTCNNDFTLNKYNMVNGHILPIAKISSDKVFYDAVRERGYIALAPPLDNKKDNAIYSIDLSKLRAMDD